MQHILNKKIRSITEAEKQKTALARAIVCHPSVFLVDEDFSRGNPRRRAEMLRDVLRINQELKITTLYITNDYQEAVNLKKRIVFMKDGEIIPEEEYLN